MNSLYVPFSSAADGDKSWINDFVHMRSLPSVDRVVSVQQEKMGCKRRGAFFTPEIIAGWMVESVLSAFSRKSSINVLEPSCGDGAFFEAFRSVTTCKQFVFDAIEVDKTSFNKIQKKYPNVNVWYRDFLAWKSSKKYDLIIGNPPYINKKMLSDEQAELCRRIHIGSGLKDKAISNIWTAFVLKSTELLSPDGVLSFVLPTELLQVNYAEEIRKFLLINFRRVEIVSFKRLAFDSIEQDTVILTAYKSAEQEEGLFFVEVDSTQDLLNNQWQFEPHHADEGFKWSSYVLTQDEIEFVSGLAKRCQKVSDLCTSTAGIVTGRNDFFILNQEKVREFNLELYVKPIIQRSLYVKDRVSFSWDDFQNIVDANKPSFLLDLNGIAEHNFNAGLKRYLEEGKSNSLPDKHKCSKRTRWFDVPSIWGSEVFFFKRSHHHPKLVINDANVYVTDSAYRIKLFAGVNANAFVASFYNSLTLLFAELTGRYYGGGVLELTPNEFKGLPIPYSARYSADEFVFNFNSKIKIDSFVLNHDDRILGDYLGLDNKGVQMIQSLYVKVRSRRMKIENGNF